MVDEHFRRALENIDRLVTPSLNLVRSLPPPTSVPAKPLSPPPQFQDILVVPLAPAPDPTTQVIDLLDEDMQPLFNVPPPPSSTLESICDQILMPPPPPIKKGGSVRVIPGKQKGKLHTTKLRIASDVVKISKLTPPVSLLKPAVVEAIAQNRPLVNVDRHENFSRSASVVQDMQNLDSFIPVDPVHLHLIMSLNFCEMININLNASDGIRPLVGISVPAPQVFQFQKAGYTIISDPAQPEAFLVVLSKSDLATIQASNLNP